MSNTLPPITGIHRGRRVVQNLITDNPIDYNVEPRFILRGAKDEMQRITRVMQTWEDEYWAFVTDGRRASANVLTLQQYAVDLRTWYRINLPYARRAAAVRMMNYWNSTGDITRLCAYYNIPPDARLMNPQFKQLFDQWNVLKAHFDTFCRIPEDLRLLNPSAWGVARILNDGYDGLPMSLPGLAELGLPHS